MPDLFAAADVAVLPRGDGGTSSSLVLALDMGLPVVAGSCRRTRRLRVGRSRAGCSILETSLPPAVSRGRIDRPEGNGGEAGRRRADPCDARLEPRRAVADCAGYQGHRSLPTVIQAFRPRARTFGVFGSSPCLVRQRPKGLRHVLPVRRRVSRSPSITELALSCELSTSRRSFPSTAQEWN